MCCRTTVCAEKNTQGGRKHRPPYLWIAMKKLITLILLLLMLTGCDSSFTPTTPEEVEDAAAMGADGVYLDFPDLIK